MCPHDLSAESVPPDLLELAGKWCSPGHSQLPLATQHVLAIRHIGNKRDHGTQHRRYRGTTLFYIRPKAGQGEPRGNSGGSTAYHRIQQGHDDGVQVE